MTHFRGQIPMLPSDSIEETQRFYHEVLGFEVAGSRYEQGGLEWIRLHAGQAQIMFYSPMASGDMPPEISTPASMILYFQLDDLPALHAQLKAAGHAVSDIGVTFYGMQEFEMSDPNGYTLMFGEPIDQD